MALSLTNRLWMSNHATSFHYRQGALDLLESGKIQITKAFKPIVERVAQISDAVFEIETKTGAKHTVRWDAEEPTFS